ncbi:MAG TPA: FAD-dependent oxidoreductase, partial [Myxococcota bacterium]|nr:FAD-dependent oxidoreductase [Myxococcota bacterium]
MPTFELDDVTQHALGRALARASRAEVHFDAPRRALYAGDGAGRGPMPLGVLIPKSLDDVLEAMTVCHRLGVPVLPRGGGTGWGAESLGEALVVDFSQYLHHIVELDPLRRRVRLQGGALLDTAAAAAGRYGLGLGAVPGSHAQSSIGGAIGTNACGAGLGLLLRDRIESLDLLTYDGVQLRVEATSEAQMAHLIDAGGRRGAIYAALRDLVRAHGDLWRRAWPRLDRQMVGYNLPALLPERGCHIARALVGAAGRCAVVLEASL